MVARRPNYPPCTSRCANAATSSRDLRCFAVLPLLTRCSLLRCAAAAGHGDAGGCRASSSGSELADRHLLRSRRWAVSMVVVCSRGLLKRSEIILLGDDEVCGLWRSGGQQWREVWRLCDDSGMLCACVQCCPPDARRSRLSAGLHVSQTRFVRTSALSAPRPFPSTIQGWAVVQCAHLVAYVIILKPSAKFSRYQAKY